jgi:uncharacterized protein
VRIPYDAEIRALHERYAPSAAAFESVFTHCVIVSRIAEQLMPPDVDAALVRAGCLLHDIGVYRLGGENYLRHGLLGHELLKSEGFPEAICRFCSCHTGVGISREDVVRQKLPLPPGDYVAVTEQERLVMYADKFHSKTNPPVFVSAESYAVSVARFGAGKAERFARFVSRYGVPELTQLSAEYGHAIV